MPRIIEFVQDTEPELKQLQEAVLGYIEPIFLSPNVTMYVNEEAIPRRLAKNERASEIAQMPIYGPVVIWRKKKGDEK